MANSAFAATRAIAVVVVAISSLVGAPARAQQIGERSQARRRVAPVDFAGVYRYSEPLEQGRARVRAALDDVEECLIPLLRPRLRSMVGRRDFLVRNLRIGVSGEEIRFRARAYRTLTVNSVPGRQEIIRSKSGRQTRVVQRFRHGRFEQIVDNDLGRMHNVYSLHDDRQRLHVVTTVTSGLLSRPVVLELDYRRVPPPRRPHRRRPPRLRRPSHPRVRSL